MITDSHKDNKTMKRRSFIKTAVAGIAVFTPAWWLIAKKKPRLDPSKELYGVSEAVKALTEIRKVNESWKKDWIEINKLIRCGKIQPSPRALEAIKATELPEEKWLTINT